MNNTTSTFIKDLLYENDVISLTRLLSIFGYLAFIVCSIYLLATNTVWADYTTFASYTGGGGAVLQLGNKYVNSRFNTMAGSSDPIRHNNSTTTAQTPTTGQNTLPELNRVNKPFVDKK